MLEKYLNKEVIIEEKQYNSISTISQMKMSKNAIGVLCRVEGIITAIDDEFVEVDNKMLIARKFIYRIILK